MEKVGIPQTQIQHGETRLLDQEESPSSRRFIVRGGGRRREG